MMHTNDIQLATETAGGTGWAIACCICGWAGDHQNWGTTPGTLTKDGAARAARRQANAHCASKTEPDAPAEHVATLVAHSPGKVSSMTCTCGVSIVGDVMPFAGVTRLMLEHLNGERGDPVLQALLDRGVTPMPRFAPGGVVHAAGHSVSPLGFPDR